MQRFIRRYVLTIAYVLVGYVVFLLSLLFYTNPFTKYYHASLGALILLFMLVRVCDDIKDYYVDSIEDKTVFPLPVLWVLFLSITGGVFFLCLFFKIYLFFILFLLIVLNFMFDQWFFRILFVPAAFCAILYHEYGFHWSNVFILSIALFASIYFGIIKGKKKEYSISQVGGKGYNLYDLHIKNTPPFFVLPVSVLFPYQEKKVQQYLTAYTRKDRVYAVRSSSILEDGERLSFAGVHESYLNVKAENIVEYVKKVMDSTKSERAIEYRKNHGISDEEPIAVIVQEMVDADYAGVLFSINPVTKNTFETVISVTRGLGEKLVDGSVDGTTYYVSKDIRRIGEDILSPKLIRKLMKLKDEVQRKRPHFQDIEFAIRRNKVYFLQARDITSIEPIGPKDLNLLIDNSNIIESYYGVTSPLTVSFAKEIYKKVYTETLLLARPSHRVMDTLKPSLENMLYCYEDKIYYNIFSWYHVTSIFPSKKSLGYMESMMGVKTNSEGYHRVKLSPIELIRLGVVFISKLRHMDELSDAFKKRFNEIIDPYYGKPINLSNEECIALYHTIDSSIIKEFTTPILNDCAVMFYFGALKNKAKKYPNGDEIIAEAISNNGNVESAGSARELSILVQYIKSHEDIFKDFTSMDVDTLMENYYFIDTELGSMLRDYIYRFGSRVMNELKLETITMIEEPVLLFSMLKSALEEEEIASLSTKETEIPKDLRKLSIKAKHYLQNRESLRLRRTYVFSVVRNIFLCLGRNFKKEGRIDDERDIFYLTKDEIFSLAANYRPAVMVAKASMKANEKKDYHDRIAFFKGKPMPVEFAASVDGITGIPSGNGIVTGKVSYLESKDSFFEPGTILLAKRTDPGWISLFPMAKGLIVEHGSMLSHSFLVAREMGLPAIAGVIDATKKIKNGDIVTLDANKGVITIEGTEEVL